MDNITMKMLLMYHCIIILGMDIFSVSGDKVSGFVNNQKFSNGTRYPLTKQDETKQNTIVVNAMEMIKSVNGDLPNMCNLISSKEIYNITIKRAYLYGQLDYILQEDDPCPVEFYWRISAPPDTVLNVTFTYLIIRHCSVHCLCDRVSIWDVVKQTKQLRGTYCGHHDPWYILSKSSEVVIGLEILDAEKSYTQLTHTAPSFLRYWYMGQASYVYNIPDKSKIQYDEVSGIMIIYRALPKENYRYMSSITKLISIGPIPLSIPHMKVKNDYIYHFKIRGFELYQVIVSWSIKCQNVSLLLFDGPSERHTPITKYEDHNGIKTAKATGFYLYIVLKIKEDLFVNRNFCANLTLSEKVQGIKKIATTFGYHTINFKKLPLVHLYNQAIGIEIFSIRGPNYDRCAVQGIIFLMIHVKKENNKPYLDIYNETYCDIPEHKKFISEDVHTDVKIQMLLVVYSYVLDRHNHAMDVVLENIGDNQLCKPVYPDLFHFRHYIKIDKHFVSYFNPFVIIEGSTENISCFYVRVSTTDDHKVREGRIRIEISGADMLMATHKKVRGSESIYNTSFNVKVKTNKCTGEIKAEKDIEKNRVIIEQKMDCVYSPAGFSLYLYNNMMCFTVSPKHTLADNLCRILNSHETASWVPKNSVLYLYCEDLICSQNIIKGPSLVIKQTPVIIRSYEGFSFVLPKSFNAILEPAVGDGVRQLQQNEDVEGDLVRQSCLKRLSWNEAFNECQQQDLHLLTINDIYELHRLRPSWIKCQTKSVETITFLGLRDGRWTNGDPVTYSEWYNPEGPIEVKQYINKNSTNNAPDQNCTALIDIRLGTVDKATYWTHIPCDEPFNNICFICQYFVTKQGCGDYNTSFTSLYNMPHIVKYNNQNVLLAGEITCPSGYNYIEGLCYKLVTSPYNITDKYTCEEAKQTCASFKGRLANINNNNNILSYLHIWLHREAYGAIWVDHCYTLAPNIYYRKSPARDRNYTFYQNANTDINILNVICETEPGRTHHSCKGHQFQCQDGTCILDHHVCDSTIDCVDGTDEINCTCDTDERFACQNNTICISASKYCDQIVDCADGSDENNCIIDGHVQFDPTLEDIIFTDADKPNEDTFIENHTGPSYNLLSAEWQDTNYRRGKWRGVNQNYTNYSPYCPEITHVRCYKDQPDCIPRHLACVYLTNPHNQVRYCPDGIHLQYCKNFHCPNMFKCPNSYCIPYNKVCNGIRDCKGGTDENNCNNLVCPGLFKCRLDGICIDQKSRCDGIIDCPISHEDEMLCESFLCPTNCHCFERSVDCSNRNISIIPNIPTDSRSFNLTLNNIDLMSSFMPKLHYLMTFVMKHCSLQIVPDNTFKNLSNMIILDLSYNKIQNFSSKVLHGLISLKKLILSNNFITTFVTDTFYHLRMLELIDLRNNIIENMPDSIFHHTYVGIMKVDEYIFCCLASHAECIAPTDAFSSCDNLIASPVLRIVIWILGVLSVFGNIFVLLWILRHRNEDRHTHLIISLFLADLIMGIYLLIIASVDMHYRGRYAHNSKLWQSTILCKLCGYLFALSSQISVGQMVIITLNRWYVLTKPLIQSPFTKSKNRILSCMNWVICLILYSIPFLFPSYFGENITQNGTCLFHNLTSGLYPGWEFMAFVYLTFNGLSFLLILGGYIWIYIAMPISLHAAARPCSLEDHILTYKMTILVVTDGICWLTIIVTGIIGLNKQQTNPQWSVWFAIFILLVNSALKPFLYSLKAIVKTLKLTKKPVAAQI